jgi:antitoxin component YwqK of YwqJK toxin-antitoxin module
MSRDLPRAHYDDISFDDQLALLDDAPFTGIIYATHPDGGLELEYNYVEGLPSGIQRQWYPGGQLEKEWDAVRGKGSVWSRQWHPNGVPKY